MTATVGLYRENKENGKRKGYSRVNLGRGRRPSDLSGPFYLRFFCPDRGKRVWEHVGNDFNTAVLAREQRENILQAKAAGIPVLEPEAGNHLKLIDAIQEYLNTGKALRKDWRPKTINAYTRSLGLFRESYKGIYFDEIGRKDVLAFLKYLRVTKNKRGMRFDDRTIHNHIINLVSFLNEYGKKGLIRTDEWPKYEEPKVVVYNDVSLTKLLETADQDERDLIEFFLGSGAREGEVAHGEYIDIYWDTAEFYIHSKFEKYGWKVKDKEQRLIPLSDVVMEMLRKRRERHPHDTLLFPSSFRTPQSHLLRVVKSVALRAGLNCGHCSSKENGKVVTCATHAVCKRFRLHKFRKTWATRRSRAGMDIVTIAEKLGHSDLDTTRKYLAAEDNASERVRAQVNAADALMTRVPPAVNT
jgi:integrase